MIASKILTQTKMKFDSLEDNTHLAGENFNL